MRRTGLIIVAGAVALAACDKRQRRHPADANQSADQNVDAGAWLAFQPSKDPEPRARHTAAWAQGRMVVWGGANAKGELLATGGVFDPVRDEWTATTRAVAPVGRAEHSMTATSRGVMVWGGTTWNPETYENEPTATGAVYGVTANQWTLVTTENAPSARFAHSAVTDGTRVMIWGGAGSTPLGDGAIYDVASARWTPMAMKGAPTARTGHSAVWIAEKGRMLIWGGASAAGLEATGAAFDPVANMWEPIAAEGAPSARTGHHAVIVGTKMVVWGGEDATGLTTTGAVFDAATGVWTAIRDSVGVLSGRGAPVAAAANGIVIIWGGSDDTGVLGDGAMYVVQQDAWVKMAADKVVGKRTGASGVWDGSALIVWGGYTDEGKFVGEPMRFVPPDVFYR